MESGLVKKEIITVRSSAADADEKKVRSLRCTGVVEVLVAEPRRVTSGAFPSLFSEGWSPVDFNSACAGPSDCVRAWVRQKRSEISYESTPTEGRKQIIKVAPGRSLAK